MSSEIDGKNIKELASSRTTRTNIISAKRGSIYSVNGDVLAQNVSSYKLLAYLDSSRTVNSDKPQHVVDKEDKGKTLKIRLPQGVHSYVQDSLNMVWYSIDDI
jgi:penicillin-binding protein 2B